ncbi:MAG: thiamine phosphate synthase, partial [Pseudomonadota bacterium]|nr:thiamine phosphate synthase [Pseudomonadota bacterium]
TNSVMSWIRSKNGIVTASVHSENLLKRAFNMEIDAIFVSPVFKTESHKGARSLGVLRFSRFSRYSELPVYALGGITAATARRLQGCEVCGLAGIVNIIVKNYEND